MFFCFDFCTKDMEQVVFAVSKVRHLEKPFFNRRPNKHPSYYNCKFFEKGWKMTILNHGENREIRCACCNKLLAKGRAAAISIKCPRCKTLNNFLDNPGVATRAAMTAACGKEK